MLSFQHFSLRNKLITINMLTAVIVLLLTSLSFLLVETIKSKNHTIDKLSSLGNIVCLHSGAALSFADKQTASETLAALDSEPSILRACLYDAEDKIFASYKRSSHSQADGLPIRTAQAAELSGLLKNKEKVVFRKDGFHLQLPVIVSREKIGTLYIHAGLDRFFDRFSTYLALVATISLFATLVAFFLSTKLQKKVSLPIKKLTDTMAEVSKNKHYSLQVENTGSDEIGLLYQGFNEMLHEIDKRDQDLMLTQYSMDHASDGICWLDENGSITNASLGACNLLKLSRKDLLQSTICQFWQDLSLEEWAGFWRDIDTSNGIHFSTDMLSRDGDKIPVEGSFHSVHLKQKLCCMLFRDVSERRKLELRLQRSQKLESLGTLVGSVAHDLNNILSALTSYPELLLLDLPCNSTLRDPLEIIQRSGLKAAAIVQDMLTISRRHNIVKTQMDINHSILEYLQSPEHKRLREVHDEIHICVDLTDDVDLISASPVHLAKCIMNLISNGAEAMVTGGDLVIRTANIYLDKVLPGYSSIEKGEYVLLQVIDSGIGISADDLRQIFDPFYSKKKMGRSGTGLGMTIVWNCVVDHNGYIIVDSEEGSGTSFALYFPADNSAEECRETVTRLEDCVGNESVLVIDDMVEQRTVASAILSKLGYAVSTVASGEEAVEFLKEHKVDVIVLDMIMPPGMDGLDTYREIIETHPGQKVVIASGFAETTRVKELQRLGNGPFIKKPYNLYELGKAVRGQLDQQQEGKVCGEKKVE